MPPLPADSIHARACKLKCEKILTRPLGGEGFRACTVNLKIIKLPKKRCSRGHYTFGTSLSV